MSSQLEDAFNEAMEHRAAGYEQRIAALDDLVQRAWRLIAGAMSGNPHKPTANSEWMDAAHRWEIDYCMGQGSSVPEYPTVSYRVRDRDSDYKAMCHEDRDHAELLLKAWLSDGRDAVIERRHVFDGGWSPVGRPFFTGQQERALDRCEAFDAATAAERERTRAMQEAIDAAVNALRETAYVGGLTMDDAYRVAMLHLGPLATEHTGQGTADLIEKGDTDA